MTLRKVRFTSEARKQIRFLKAWWRENAMRPEILDEDLTEAVRFLSALPGIGSAYRGGSIRGTRRLYLERLTTHLYYTFDDREVVIHALWHARRGSGPDFGR